MFAALAMRLNPVKSEATAARGQRRPWSLVARLAVFYTLGTTALLLVTMVILYGVVVRYSDANDNLFLNDKLRAVRADLAIKNAALGQCRAQWADQIREVSVEWLLVAALNQDLAAIAKHKRAKTIPLRLEDPLSFGG